jgi:DedD protein
MGLLDFLQRDRSGATPAAAANGEQAEQARARAKRRLIGAVVLLGIGVIAFPLLFETQPRPIPVDIPIQIPSRESAAPLVLPPARPSPAASLPAAAPAPKAAAAPAVPAPAAVEPARVEPAPAPKATPAKAEPAPPAPPKTAEAPGRFVVQVGAFAEASAVREARAKVEKLGLVTYTQQVETASGPRTRVRLGPFATREEADQAAAKVKAAGLPGAVLAL